MREDARLPPTTAIHPCRLTRLPNSTGQAKEPYTTRAITFESYPGSAMLLITSATIGTAAAVSETPKREPAGKPKSQQME